MSTRRFQLRGVNYKKVSLLIGLSVLLADQLVKVAVRQSLAPFASIPEEGVLRISHVPNEGLLFGIDAPMAVSLLLPGIALAIFLFIYWRYVSLNNRLLSVAAGLFIGACLGNLVDRMVFGSVTDIFDVAVSDGFGRVVFNVADLCSIAGIIVFDVFLIKLRLARVPKQQYLIPYLWRGLVEAERSRSRMKPTSVTP